MLLVVAYQPISTAGAQSQERMTSLVSDEQRQTILLGELPSEILADCLGQRLARVDNSKAQRLLARTLTAAYLVDTADEKSDDLLSMQDQEAATAINHAPEARGGLHQGTARAANAAAERNLVNMENAVAIARLQKFQIPYHKLITVWCFVACIRWSSQFC